jgi:stage V sporulation protein B
MLGVYQIAMSFFMVALTVIASGLPLAISKETAKAAAATAQKHKPHTLHIASAGLVISLIASCVLCALVFALNNLLGAIFTDARCLTILLVLLPAVIACSVYTVLRAVWWGERRFFLLGVTELFEQVIRIVLFTAMLALPFSVIDAAGIAGLSYTIACFASAGVVAYIFLRGRARQVKVDRTARKTLLTDTMKPLLASAAPITGVRIIGSIAMPLISIIIPFRMVTAGFLETQAITQYGIAVGMTMPLLTIPGTIISALATALVPELSGAFARGDTTTVSRQIGNALRFTLFITFLLVPAFLVLGENIGSLLFGNTTAGTYLSASAWIMIPLALSQITNAILNSLGAETKTMKHYFVGSLLLFTCVWFLPGTLGVQALLVGMGLCMSITAILNIRLISKMTKTRANILHLILLFSLLCLPSALACTWLFNLTNLIWPPFISLAMASASGVTILLLLCQIFQVIDLKSFKLRKSKTST